MFLCFRSFKPDKPIIKKNTTRRKRSSQSGCFFLLTTGLILIGLLIANFFFVRTFFGSNIMRIDMGVFNAIQFVLPILLVFIEFWIYDAMVDYFRYRNIESLKEPESPDDHQGD